MLESYEEENDVISVMNTKIQVPAFRSYMFLTCALQLNLCELFYYAWKKKKLVVFEGCVSLRY